MLGLPFENAMKTLFQERGYKVLTSIKDSLGYEAFELLDIAKEYATATYKNTNKHFGDKEKVLSAKAVLDHYFKIDDLLELPRSSKSAPVNIVGIQWFCYSENWAEDLVEQKLKEKMKQLQATHSACKEIYLHNTYLIAGYVPSYWDGIGFRTDDQNRRIKDSIDELVIQMKDEATEPRLLKVSFDFKS